MNIWQYKRGRVISLINGLKVCTEMSDYVYTNSIYLESVI